MTGDTCTPGKVVCRGYFYDRSYLFTSVAANNVSLITKGGFTIISEPPVGTALTFEASVCADATGQIV
jgi:hypothetical protein